MAEEQDRELTDTNSVLGTANYMSPEQMRAPKEVDARSDLYALGVILYQCATAKRPFDGANAYEVMHAIMTASVPPPSFFRSEIPRTFDSIVLRAMRREPSERFACARELGRALSAFASDPAMWLREFAPLLEREESKASSYPLNEHKSWPPSGAHQVGLLGANRARVRGISSDLPRGTTAKSITFDDSRFPLIVVTAVGRLTDVEYAAYLDECTARIIDRGEVYAFVYDGSGIEYAEATGGLDQQPSGRNIDAEPGVRLRPQLRETQGNADGHTLGLSTALSACGVSAARGRDWVVPR
jgi:hypothetical protein